MKAASELNAHKDRIRDLKAQLEYTHTHYQNLLEQVDGAALLSEVEHVPHTRPSSQHVASSSSESQEPQMPSQPPAAVPGTAPVEKYDSIIHTPSMPFANHQLNQERHLRLLQSQLDGHKLRADEFERLSERLAADLDNMKERHSAAGHRQFQAVRKLEAEIAQLKSAVAVAEQTGRFHTEETKAAHDKQVAAMKLANDVLQQQLARMAESVPAMLRAKSEQIGQQQEASMAIEDKVQAAVDQHVTAACAGHAQELEAVRQQLQQILDRRAQEAEASSSAHAANKAAQQRHIVQLQDEVSQQYIYIERIESVLGSMQRQHCSSQMRADLQLLHLSKPLPGEGQPAAALRARSAIAARCQQGFQGANAAGGQASTSPRPFTAPVSSSASPLYRLATLPHLLSQPSEMPASWNTPPTPSPTQPKPPAAVKEAAPWHKLAQQEAAMQVLQAKQAEQEQRIQSLQTDVARYKAAMQEAQTKSRSLAVAMQSLQRKPAQWPAMPSLESDHQSQPVQQAHTLLKPAMKQQPMSGSGREAIDRLQPMTASSVMQAKLGAPASILPRPGSALNRSTGSVSSLRLGGQQVARRPVSAKVKEFDAINALLS
ncbi:hypothetical protein WJX77_011905 [Trebouxia sp. C0004]